MGDVYVCMLVTDAELLSVSHRWCQSSGGFDITWHVHTFPFQRPPIEFSTSFPTTM